MLQARLELALGYTPNWILSPTRLPIPPLERTILSFHLTPAESVDCVYLPSPQTILNRSRRQSATGAYKYSAVNTTIII